MLKRFWTIFIARNKEYLRDRAAFGWNFMFPFLIIAGFFIMFQRGGTPEYKCGIIPPESSSEICVAIPGVLTQMGMLTFVDFDDRETGFEKLRNHKLDLLIEQNSTPIQYWINDSSPNGAIAESLLLKALYEPDQLKSKATKQLISGERIDYIDWFFPGILAMNMMFSALYGVGYVIVRYRKNGTLKRLKATPLTPFEYLSAQVLSRMFLILFSSTVVYSGCSLLFDFHCKGSFLDLIIFFTLGGVSIISLALIIASRTASEEFTEGILNMTSWPMMFLSEVWFSLEGAPEWVRHLSQFLPLPHVTEGMRRIINEGATLGELGFQIMALSLMSLVFMAMGSFLFKWVR